MSYNNYENYYRDDNGKIHRDIPLGTAPGDAYVRTNTRLKEEIKRVDDRIDQSVEDINNRITNIDIADTCCIGQRQCDLDVAVASFQK